VEEKPHSSALETGSPDSRNGLSRADSGKSTTIDQPAITNLQPEIKEDAPSGRSPVRVPLKKTIRKEESTSNRSTTNESSREKSFTQADLDKFWDDYSKNGKDAYLRSLFQYCRPVLSEGYRIEISVINPEQERQLREESSKIKRYLSECLQNDLIFFDLQKKESDSEESLFTDREKYNYLLGKNSALEFLVKEFNLRLD
jgi:hypothetical protein